MPSTRSLSFRLAAATAMLVAPAAGLVATGLPATGDLGGRLHHALEVRRPTIELLLEADRDFHQMLVAERTLLQPGIDDPARTELRATRAENLEQAESRFTRAVDRLAPEDEPERWRRTVAERLASWPRASDAVHAAAAGGRPDEARRLALERAAPAFEAARSVLDELTVHLQAGRDRALAAGDAVVARPTATLAGPRRSPDC